MALKKRIVVVGLGSIGRRHTRLLLERDDLQVEVMEVDRYILEGSLQQLGNLPSHDSYEQMLHTHPEVVWLATPTHLHSQQAIAALKAGIHVFCEKPMTISLSEAKLVKAASEKADRVFNVGFNLHFWNGLIAVKELITSGILGNIMHVYARVGTYVTLVNSLSRYQAAQAGSLFFDYAHQPDIIYWLLGEIPTSVYVPAFQGGNLAFSSNPNVADIICEYNIPLLSHIHLNYVQMPQRHEYEVVGDKGWVFIDFETGIMKVGSQRNQSIDTTVFIQERDDIFRAEHSAFFEAIEGKRSPETSAEEGLVSTAICESAVKSWKTGKKVSLSFD